MSTFNVRRKLEFLVLFFMIVFTFAAGEPQWIGWVRHSKELGFHRQSYRAGALHPPLARVPLLSMQATMTALLSILVMIDFMFLNEGDFLFEPDIKNYARKTAPQY
jgi:hypothetical protein